MSSIATEPTKADSRSLMTTVTDQFITLLAARYPDLFPLPSTDSDTEDLRYQTDPKDGPAIVKRFQDVLRALSTRISPSKEDAERLRHNIDGPLSTLIFDLKLPTSDAVEELYDNKVHMMDEGHMTWNEAKRQILDLIDANAEHNFTGLASDLAKTVLTQTEQFKTKMDGTATEEEAQSTIADLLITTQAYHDAWLVRSGSGFRCQFWRSVV